MKISFRGVTFHHNDCILKGEQIKLMRVRSHKTTKEVADFLKLKSHKTIVNWQTERSFPSADQCIAMAKYCGLDPARFIDQVIQQFLEESSNAEVSPIDWDACKLDGQ